MLGVSRSLVEAGQARHLEATFHAITHREIADR
jgi:hypothetical protein